jgi:hypothetical protein
MSLGSELSWKYAVLSELLVEPVVHMHPEPVEDVHMVSEQMEDGRWASKSSPVPYL